VYRPRCNQFESIPSFEFSDDRLVSDYLSEIARKFRIGGNCSLRIRSATGSIFTLPSDERLNPISFCRTLAIIPRHPNHSQQSGHVAPRTPYLELVEPSVDEDQQEGRLLLRIPVFDPKTKQIYFSARIPISTTPNFFATNSPQSALVSKILRCISRLFSSDSQFTLFDSTGSRLPNPIDTASNCVALIDKIFQDRIFIQGTFGASDRQLSKRASRFSRASSSSRPPSCATFRVCSGSQGLRIRLILCA
jgi:hypothetical protein